MITFSPSTISKKLSTFIDLDDEEIPVVEAFTKSRAQSFSGRDLVHEGQNHPPTYVLRAGWAFSYKIQQNGERQIVGFHIPGDFLGLRSLLTHRSDHSIEPIQSIQAAEIHISDLTETFMKTPEFATAILSAACREEAILVERIVSLGRRGAEERMAHFLLELCTRLAAVGMASKAGYACPLTQYHLADALGMSGVHVNRVLRKLREAGMVKFRDGFVTFIEYNRLVDFAEFDPQYLS